MLPSLKAYDRCLTAQTDFPEYMTEVSEKDFRKDFQERLHERLHKKVRRRRTYWKFSGHCRGRAESLAFSPLMPAALSHGRERLPSNEQ